MITFTDDEVNEIDSLLEKLNEGLEDFYGSGYLDTLCVDLMETLGYFERNKDYL